MAVKIQINRQFLVKAAIIFLSVAMVVLTPIILLDYNIEASLIKPAVYKQILSDQKIYQDVSHLVTEQLIQQLHAADSEDSKPVFIHITKNSEQILMNLNQDELQELISSLMPSEWAQVKLDSLIDQYFASMNNGIYRPNLLIAMKDIKSRLQSKTGLSFFVTLIRSQPPCSEAEKQSWLTAPLEEAPACFPSETILKESEPKTSELLDQIAARMPDDASLNYFFGTAGFAPGQPSTVSRLQDSAARFWKARIWVRISPTFILILLFLLGLFHNSARPFTKLWSYPVIFGGLAGLFMSLLLWPMTQLSINTGLLPKLPESISPALISTGAGVAKAALARISPLISIQSILITMLGILLFFADRIGKQKLKIKKPQAKKYTLE